MIGDRTVSQISRSLARVERKGIELVRGEIQKFHTVPIGIEHVIAIGVVGSVVLWAEELRKVVVRRRQAPQPTKHTRWDHATR